MNREKFYVKATVLMVFLMFFATSVLQIGAIKSIDEFSLEKSRTTSTSEILKNSEVHTVNNPVV